MSNVATSTPDRRDDDQPAKVHRQFDTQKSDAHVSQLIAIGNHSSQFLILPASFDERVDVSPEAVSTALETFQLAHLRLRDLIDEQRRWSLAQSPDEETHDQLLKSTVELYKSKTSQADTHNRPSIFLRPKIARFDVGWVVRVGDGPPMKQHLHGVGASPELAMQAFDAAYRAVEKIADAQPPAPPPAPKTARKKKP